MKKTFESIALISLLIFSFFLTDKTSKVIKDLDEIMIMIKKNKNGYEINSINATILNKSIIPGISKRKVNINKSYSNMKQYGKYNPNLYIYNYIKPKISIRDNKDKYINSGNKNKGMVSLNFVINNLDELNDIVNILNKENIKGNFFIKEEFLSDNLDLVYSLINDNHNIGINGNRNIKYMNTIITKIGKQKNIYCLYKNDNTMNACIKVDGFTIKGHIIRNNYYSVVANNLDSGSIFTFVGIDNLELIIKYIKKRGYTISNLSDHIKEDIEKK